MQRTRSYHRKMRAKHIKRKKRITSYFPGADTSPYYADDGRYSKNKIHCSCRMCRSTDYNGKHILTMQEKKALDRFNADTLLWEGSDYVISTYGENFIELYDRNYPSWMDKIS